MKTKEEKLALCGRSFYSYLREHADEYGDRTYLFGEKRAYTWAQARRIVESLAYSLRAAGVRRGAFVALRAVRSIETALLWQALTLAGAVSVMTDAHFSARDFIAQSGVELRPDYYLTDEGIEGCWTLKDAEYRDRMPLSFAAPPDHDPAEAERMDGENDVTALSLIIFTSGSTGKSKAVMLCQRNYIANSVDGGDLFEEGAGDISALVLPLHHIFGLSLLVCSTVSGHAVFFPEDPSPGSLPERIARYGVTVLYAVPTYFLALAESDAPAGSDLSSLRFGLIAGGPSTPAQMARIERALGCRLVPVYGMSEYVGITTLPYASPSELRCAGVGSFYPLNDGSILREDGSEAERGEEGELCVRGPDLMLGYYGDEAETRAAIDAQGRLHTGDLGYMDERGIVHITGRKKEIIIRGGENISAAKIERALLSVPGVLAAAAVGLRDVYFGEVPFAAVIPRKGAALGEEALRRALAGKLSKHEVPCRIFVTESFPLTGTGKTDKQALKERMEVWKTV